MPLTIIIAGLAIALFLAYFFYTHFQRSGYLLFVVFFLPLMDLGVTPAAFGGLLYIIKKAVLPVFSYYPSFTAFTGQHCFRIYPAIHC